MKITWVIGNVFALAGLIAAIYYILVSRGPVVISNAFDPTLTRSVQRIRKRRKFGAALMAVIAILFLVAVNRFSGVQTPAMMLFWLLLLVLLLWLLVIGTLDFLAIGRLRRQLDNQSGDHVNRLFKDTPFPTKIKHDDKDKK